GRCASLSGPCRNFAGASRRNPKRGVMTWMATATFPDGTLREVRDVMLIAANLFSAGQETTARLLGAMFHLIGERPELQQLLRDERGRVPNFVEEGGRAATPPPGPVRPPPRAPKGGSAPHPPRPPR